MIPSIALGLIFNWFYQPYDGFLSWWLRTFLNITLSTPILGQEALVTYAIVAVSMIPSISFGMIFFLTGLAGLDIRLIEAARLDGARKWSLFFYIVLPELRASVFLAYITAFLNALRSFDLVLIMTAGGPYGSSNVLAHFMYQEAFFSYRYGYGATIATVLFGFAGVLLIALLVYYSREFR